MQIKAMNLKLDVMENLVRLIFYLSDTEEKNYRQMKKSHRNDLIFRKL